MNIKELWLRLGERVRRYDDGHNFTCDVCGREVFENERICRFCYRDLPLNNGKVCPFCGRRVREEGVCLECKAKPLGVKKARSACLHEGEAARLVVRFKRGEKYLYRALCDLMEPVVKAEFEDADAYLGVPMSEKSLKKRGYNQAELLAEELARRLGKEWIRPVEKRKETGVQKLLGRSDREKNLESVFHVSDRKGVKGRRILIVDDTLTTGATVSVLADALKRAGAAEVYAVTATSVEFKNQFGKPPSA